MNDSVGVGIAVTTDIAQLESWLAAHEAFARTLREDDEPKRLIRRYCDRVVRMRGRLTVLKHPEEAPDMTQVLHWTSELDATAAELQSLRGHLSASTLHRVSTVGSKTLPT